MKFSIVITTYNRLSLLQRAVASALAQTESCEIIVVDDGSSDGTSTYLHDLEGEITFWRNNRNLGHSAAMNEGVKLAGGDWIKPLDDDDYLAPNCLEKMSAAIQLHPQAVLCSCQASQVQINGKVIGYTPRRGTQETFYIPQADIHFGMLIEQVALGTTSQVAFQRKAFLGSGGWDAGLDVCDEIDSWIRIAEFGDAILLNSRLVYRTVWSGGNNQKASLPKRLSANLQMKGKIYARVSERHRTILPPFETVRNYLKLHWLLVALKQRQLAFAYRLTSQDIFSFEAWRLFLTAILYRISSRFKHPQIRYVFLTETEQKLKKELMTGKDLTKTIKNDS